MKNSLRLISLILALIMLCSIPMVSMAGAGAHIANSEWNNKTRAKIITVQFDSQSKHAPDFEVYVTVWCKVGPGGKPHEVISNERMSIAEKGTGENWHVTGTQDFRIEYGQEYNPRVSRWCCYYKYQVTYVYNGKTYVARISDWNKA